MSIFKKIGKGIKNATKFVGKNVVKVAAIAAPIAALAIPGVGGAISNVAGKVLGKLKGGGATNAAQTALQGVAPKPEGSGGLFGKGGLFGTGLLASTEWDKHNKTLKWAKKDAKMLQKAADLLGIPATSLEELKAQLTEEQYTALESHVEQEISQEPNEEPKNGSSDTIKYAAIAAVVTKVLGIW